MSNELKILALLDQAKAGLAVGQIAKLLDITHQQANRVLRRLHKSDFIDNGWTDDFLKRRLWRAK